MSPSNKQYEPPDLLGDFVHTRKISNEIASSLSAEDMQIQSMTDASPTKWHLAHTSWAFETFILKPHFAGYQVFHPKYEYLFNSYYNAVGLQYPRDQRGKLSRPDLKTVINYRNYVDQAVIKWLSINSLLEEKNKALSHLFKLLINHEQQHQELMLTDIQHALFSNPEFPIYRQSEELNHRKTTQVWKKFDAGLYSIGHKNETFYFDNEGPQHQVYLEDYQLSSQLVTCAEYIEFIEQGAYQTPANWLSEAWYKIKQKKLTAPLYWIKRNDQWFHFTLSGLKPIDLHAPVSNINYFEASAYASSVGKRLPTEQEWEVAANTIELEGSFYQPNVLSPAPSPEAGQLNQMFGELWQWTSSSYNAYPGFKVSDDAIGEYNGKFMVNQYVLRGGSFATQSGHVRASYRNFFYPDASWQYTGIRLAESM